MRIPPDAAGRAGFRPPRRAPRGPEKSSTTFNPRKDGVRPDFTICTASAASRVRTSTVAAGASRTLKVFNNIASAPRGPGRLETPHPGFRKPVVSKTRVSTTRGFENPGFENPCWIRDPRTRRASRTRRPPVLQADAPSGREGCRTIPGAVGAPRAGECRPRWLLLPCSSEPAALFHVSRGTGRTHGHDHAHGSRSSFLPTMPL